MKGIYSKKLKKSYAGIIGGAGCGILIFLAYKENESGLSVNHFILLIVVLLYICIATSITMFLENRSFFQENGKDKKRFIIFNVLFASVSCAMLILSFMIANYALN